MASENGRRITPAIGTVYYIKQVSDSYLPLKFQYEYCNLEGPDYKKIRKMYAITAIDDRNYTEVGFIINNDLNATLNATIAGSVTITSSNGGAVSTVSVTDGNFPGLSLGWVGYVNCGLATGEDGYILPIAVADAISYTPYWITPDGVRVLSPVTRVFYCTDGTVDGLAEIK